jgi:Tol biopolymer transport system component
MRTLSLLIVLASAAAAQSTQRMSIGTLAHTNDELCSISADGRFVAFSSTATNLAPSDMNPIDDVFVRDLQTGTTELVSVPASGGNANQGSYNPSISGDGRFVAFFSAATNLVAGATHHGSDVYVRDRQNGTTELVSVPIGAGTTPAEIEYCSISADGRFVAFQSKATDLVAGDTNAKSDIFVRDRLNATTERVSISTGGVQSNGDSDSPFISADGNFVAFGSAATNLVSGDTNGVGDIFVRNRQMGTTVRVSVDSGGVQANAASSSPAISADGTFVTFASTASNLVAGDTNGVGDVFLRNQSLGTTERVSLANDGSQGDALSGLSISPVSPDGRYVAFDSNASNIVAGDSPGGTDVFIRDRQTSTTVCVSIFIPTGIPFNQGSGLPMMSSDGRFVAYFTLATNIVPGSLDPWNIVAWDRQSGITVLVSTGVTQANGASDQCSISADGRCVAFGSSATNLILQDTNALHDVFVYDRLCASLQLVSMGWGFVAANGPSNNPVLSSDGRYVVFDSQATNLLSTGATNPVTHVFRFDRLTLAMVRLSVSTGNSPGVLNSSNPAISSDGLVVAFQSDAANLVAGDTNGVTDVFVRDAGTTERVSLGAGAAQGDHASDLPSISSDGRYVAFASDATNFVSGDTNGFTDIFVRDRQSGTTDRVSVATGGVQSNGSSGTLPSISADGRYVAFASDATNLVAGDTNGATDVFVHDRQTGATERVSVASDGTQGNFGSSRPAISGSGRFVVFESDATNFAAGDTNGKTDVFLHDRQTGTTVRASVDSSGAQANDRSDTATVSSDGRYVAFRSNATNLAPFTANNSGGVYLRDRGVASSFTSFCFGDGSAGGCPCANNGSAGHGCQNSGGTGGGLLTATGVASLSADSVVVTSSGELPTALSIYLQGTSAIAPTIFGDGLRCAGGTLKRLYSKHAVGGTISAPQSGDPSISARSAALGDTIPLGATRVYQVYYRDANLVFCAGGFNVSTAIAVAWGM